MNNLKLHSIQIPADAPGQHTQLQYYTLSPPKPSAKIYIQAALHADEQPGTMILHFLLQKLAASKHKPLAQFTILPMANPLGMQNIHLQHHTGRYHSASGTNYNRQWPDLHKLVTQDNHSLHKKLSRNAASNRRLILGETKKWLKAQTPASALQAHRLAVTSLAYDADIVLDLHCDNNALKHIFTFPQFMPEYQDLSDHIQAKAVLVAEMENSGTFEETWINPWLKLARQFPDKNIPPPPFSATIEWRGQGDVGETPNKKDAEQLFHFFQARKLISGTPPRPSRGAVARHFNATQVLRAPEPGLLDYRVKPGDKVKVGETVADLVALHGPDAFRGRTPLKAATSGLVLSTNYHKYVWRGASVAKIVGSKPLPDRGDFLLED